ncbi:hypothetical protein BU25DRAFT_423821 [Macroventuria anomochaeta]|uniref:Uncharacterized protein n=1 Tax=Macroventuria anomochaeta TaxID=301207 RepID=A0ACB6RSJ7_9PLEO|nr:uncharacterized protein BU25DRAFT_423821 [Macroventuria anomochaeta]KAF2624703.1 hypothetical protein BU25DRAFT_423821 [Macroventuria anomochaeta]
MASGALSLEEFPAYLNTQKNLSSHRSSEGTPDDDKEIQHLIRNANKLANVLRSPAMKVALLGAQGIGKSLSTNAIFDCDGFSLPGADGAACTSTVTRYIDYPRGGSGGHRFFAKIKFLDAEKRKALPQEHARSYHEYQHADEDWLKRTHPRRRRGNAKKNL